MERPDELDRFRARYRVTGTGVLPEIERRVIGGDFGANGYTTMSQADELGTRLALDRSSRLLDVGTGCGWPALYLGETTGCEVVGTDVPFEGLVVAVTRIAESGTAARSWLAGASGAELPFRPASFDAVVHADVLC